MKKSILAVAVTSVLLTGCASMNPWSKDADQIAKQETLNKIEFLATNGGIELEFTDSGQWSKLQSTGIAEVSSNRMNSAHEAYAVATLRAQRNLAEYLNNDLRSKTNLDAISEIIDSDDVAKPNSDTLTYNLTENISKESHAILNGLYVVERKFDEDEQLVSVTIEVTPKSLKASHMVKSAMEVGND